jgi:hypothetical protein
MTISMSSLPSLGFGALAVTSFAGSAAAYEIGKKAIGGPVGTTLGDGTALVLGAAGAGGALLAIKYRPSKVRAGWNKAKDYAKSWVPGSGEGRKAGSQTIGKTGEPESSKPTPDASRTANHPPPADEVDEVVNNSVREKKAEENAPDHEEIKEPTHGRLEHENSAPPVVPEDKDLDYLKRARERAQSFKDQFLAEHPEDEDDDYDFFDISHGDAEGHDIDEIAPEEAEPNTPSKNTPGTSPATGKKRSSSSRIGKTPTHAVAVRV